jgi:hypothetical protein
MTDGVERLAFFVVMAACMAAIFAAGVVTFNELTR